MLPMQHGSVISGFCNTSAARMPFSTCPDLEPDLDGPEIDLESDTLGTKSLHTCSHGKHILKTFLSNEREGRCNTKRFQTICLDVVESRCLKRKRCLYCQRFDHRLQLLQLLQLQVQVQVQSTSTSTSTTSTSTIASTSTNTNTSTSTNNTRGP